MQTQVEMIELRNDLPNAQALHEIRRMIGSSYEVVAVIPIPSHTYVYLKRSKYGMGNQDIPHLDIDTAEHTVKID